VKGDLQVVEVVGVRQCRVMLGGNRGEMRCEAMLIERGVAAALLVTTRLARRSRPERGG
jgi:hypothetical protein